MSAVSRSGAASASGLRQRLLSPHHCSSLSGLTPQHITTHRLEHCLPANQQPPPSLSSSPGRRSATRVPCRHACPRVVAMANPRRVKMVAQQIRREVSEMLLFDKVVRDTITPEHALGADKYLSSIASVSDVEVSGDLQVVKVFVSVYGDERGQELAMAGLKSLAGYVRQGLGKRMRLRFTPEVRFYQDEALERGSRVLSILTQLEKERTARERGEAAPHTPMIVVPEDDDNDYFDDFGDFGLPAPEPVKKEKKPEPRSRSSGSDAEGDQIYLL